MTYIRSLAVEYQSLRPDAEILFRTKVVHHQHDEEFPEVIPGSDRPKELVDEVDVLLVAPLLRQQRFLSEAESVLRIRCA